MKQVSLQYAVRSACRTGSARTQSAVLKAAEGLRSFG
jgi:hypothetical protein